MNNESNLSRVAALTLLGVGCALLSVPTARGTILLQESFAYTPGDSLSGQNGGTGFNAPWSIGGAGGSVTVVAPTAFSSYGMQGNAIEIATSSYTGEYQSTIAARQLAAGATAVSAGSNLYSSFLFTQFPAGTLASQPNTDTFAAQSEFRLNSSQFGDGRADRTATSAALRQAPVTIFGNNNPDQAGVRYGTGDVVRSNSGPVLGDTYLIVSEFTNFNGSGGQTATMWGLTGTDYDAILAAGGFSAANLDAHNAFRVQDDSSSGGVSVAAGQFLQLTESTDFGISQRVQFDELKIFTDFNDLTAVPEPSTVIAGILATGSLGIRIRSRRKSRPVR